ncbi:MAG: glutamine cyclotransferase [Flavobacteriaceae bacterium]|nr:glutamine cyclotransferase [Flavobacteriaceae bacterium]|tara:strand:- start:33232 stop:34254 length:1023 start_codon:yes stop_codon:yes gene_type:complete
MKVSLLSLILILFLKCNSEIQENFSLKIDSPNKKIKINDSINLNVINKNNIEIDSIHFFLNEMKIDQTYTLKNISTGENKIKVIVYQNKQETILNQKIIIFSKNPPKLYSYKIINEFPHDQQAYTQGLEFDGDELYESTGLNGKSSLRKISFENGEIKKNVPLNQSYFGEGLTIINNKIIQLTWKSKIGFVYDKITMDLKSSFQYKESAEGWGLCNDGEFLYKSDGTNKIWKLDPNSYQEISYIEVYTNKSKLNKLNELEWVNGDIYANTYQFKKDVVVIINPVNGSVKGVVDFSGLKNKVNQHPNLNVLNGIAFSKKRNSFFITGKNWNKIFEVLIFEK